jgi:mRNA-degrading endonuclease toxin of MazEF toxin-antitoxin module
MVAARAQPRRGEIWWAVADKRRPVVIVQADLNGRWLLRIWI